MPKYHEMNPGELYEERTKLLEEAQALAEKGNLSARDTQRFNAIEASVKAIDMTLGERQAAISAAAANATTGGGGSWTPGGQVGQGPFPSLGHQLQAVAASTRSGRMDDRLAVVMDSAGMQESVPSEGGFLVQTDFSDRLLNRAVNEAVLAPRCNTIPLSGGSNGIKLPMVDESSRANGSRWGGIRSYWEGEGATLTDSKPKIRLAQMELKKLTGLCYATEELVEDAAALGTVIEQGFGDEFGFRIDDAVLRGTGSGQPLGVLNSGALVTQAAESGQASDSLVYENMTNMWSRMLPRNRKNAIWLINQELEPQLYGMSLAVGTGGAPVFLPGGQASDQPFSSFFARPIIPMEQCSAKGDVGDVMLIDPSAYLLLRKNGMRTQTSIHVRFLTDEVAFKFVLRIDGQPMFSSTLTPYKGTLELSPYVTLAAR